jgi:hypothetical protein
MILVKKIYISNIFHYPRRRNPQSKDSLATIGGVRTRRMRFRAHRHRKSAKKPTAGHFRFPAIRGKTETEKREGFPASVRALARPPIGRVI